MKLTDVLIAANIALRLIQARLLTVICLAITAALFGAAMWIQTVLGLIIAATWGLSIFLPVLFIGRGGSDVPQAPQHSEGPAPGE